MGNGRPARAWRRPNTGDWSSDGVASIGLDAELSGTLICRRIGPLRAVHLLPGHTRIESTIRYPGIEVADVLATAERIENGMTPALRTCSVRPTSAASGNERSARSCGRIVSHLGDDPGDVTGIVAAVGSGPKTNRRVSATAKPTGHVARPTLRSYEPFRGRFEGHLSGWDGLRKVPHRACGEKRVKPPVV